MSRVRSPADPNRQGPKVQGTAPLEVRAHSPGAGPASRILFGSALEDDSHCSLPATPDGSVYDRGAGVSKGIQSVSVLRPTSAELIQGDVVNANANSFLPDVTTPPQGRRPTTPGYGLLKTEHYVDRVADIMPGSLSYSMPAQQPGKSKSPPKMPLHIPRGRAAPTHALTAKETTSLKRQTLKSKQGDLRHYKGVGVGVSSYEKPAQLTVRVSAKDKLGNNLSCTSIVGRAKTEFRQMEAHRLREEKKLLKEMVGLVRACNGEELSVRVELNRRGDALTKLIAERLVTTNNPHKGLIMRCLTKAFVHEVVARWDMHSMSDDETDRVVAFIQQAVVTEGKTLGDPTMTMSAAAAAAATVSDGRRHDPRGADVNPASRLATQLPGYGMRKPRVTTARADPWRKAVPTPQVDLPTLSPSLVVAAPPGCGHANLALGMAHVKSLIRSAGPTEVVTSNDFHPKVANPNFQDLTNPLGEVDYGPRDKIKRDIDDIFDAFTSECATMTCMRMTDVEKGAFRSNISPTKTRGMLSSSRSALLLSNLSSTGRPKGTNGGRRRPVAVAAGVEASGHLDQDSMTIDLRSAADGLPVTDQDMDDEAFAFFGMDEGERASGNALQQSGDPKPRASTTGIIMRVSSLQGSPSTLAASASASGRYSPDLLELDNINPSSCSGSPLKGGISSTTALP